MGADEHAALEIVPLRRATLHRFPRVRKTLSLSAGTDGDSAGNLIPAGRSNQQKLGRALVELEPELLPTGAADSLAIPNRREHTLLGPCFLPLQ